MIGLSCGIPCVDPTTSVVFAAAVAGPTVDVIDRTIPAAIVATSIFFFTLVCDRSIYYPPEVFVTNQSSL
jgi:hypothetical protein